MHAKLGIHNVNIGLFVSSQRSNKGLWQTQQVRPTWSKWRVVALVQKPAPFRPTHSSGTRVILHGENVFQTLFKSDLPLASHANERFTKNASHARVSAKDHSHKSRVRLLVNYVTKQNFQKMLKQGLVYGLKQNQRH